MSELLRLTRQVSMYPAWVELIVGGVLRRQERFDDCRDFRANDRRRPHFSAWTVLTVHILTLIL